ncbi:MAG: hypothetical protein IKU72_02505 [Oscillospiraceae bacterium]|nr:hypothetical protein [Oscillospiraceae bacterium]
MKKLLSLLIALLMLLTMVVPAQAKNEASDVQVKSGSTYAKVGFVVEKVLAIEGTVSTNDKTGFKVKSIEITKTEDGSIVQFSSEGDQFVVIGQNIPANLKLTVELESNSPMQDGVYDVTLSYGRTGTNGQYNSSNRLVAKIYVGVEMPSGDESKARDSSESSNNTSTGTTVVEESEIIADNPLVEEESEDEGSNRVGMLGMLETYELRSALEEAKKLKEYGGLTSGQMTKLQDAIDAGEEALLDDRQSVVDEAAANLYAVIDELGGPVEEREEKKTSDRSGIKLSLPIILAVAAALVAIAAVVAGYLLKKKKKNGYDGAPDVDYHIGDDDEA